MIKQNRKVDKMTTKTQKNVCDFTMKIYFNYYMFLNSKALAVNLLFFI